MSEPKAGSPQAAGAAEKTPKAAGAAEDQNEMELPDEASRPAPAPPEPDYFNQLLRLKAEFENYRKRVDREKPEFFRLGKAEVLLKLLPLYDLLQHAHTEVQQAHMDTPLAKGMDGIFREFEKIFREEGVTPMSPLGKPFDAMLHEVMGTVEKAGYEDGTVADVLQNGFMLNDKVLRTAKVRICRSAEPGAKREQ